MISVIVATTIHGMSHLVRLMPGLSEEVKSINGEIIIINNNSRDGSVNFLQKYDCTIINNTINRGFAYANNQAARIAKHEYILLLNNDIITRSGFLKAMRDTFDNDDKCAAVGTLLYRTKDKAVLHAGIYFTEEYIPYELGLEVPDHAPAIRKSDPRCVTTREVPAVTGACMMIKKEVWDAVGGLNEDFKNGWEDNDFSLKLQEHSYTTWFCGTTHLYHTHHGSIHAGRFTHEDSNRQLYEKLWVQTGMVQKIVKDFYGRNKKS